MNKWIRLGGLFIVLTIVITGGLWAVVSPMLHKVYILGYETGKNISCTEEFLFKRGIEQQTSQGRPIYNLSLNISLT